MALYLTGEEINPAKTPRSEADMESREHAALIEAYKLLVRLGGYDLPPSGSTRRAYRGRRQ